MTGPIEPGMGPFHHPSPSPKARRRDFFLLFLPAPTNMGKIVICLDLLTDGWVIISCIQTQVLRLRLSWLGTGDDYALQRRAEQFYVMTIGSLND